MTWTSATALGVVLVLAPLLPGVATRVKSQLTGRRGPPVLQLYFELAKLLRKRAVFSAATTELFRLAPVAGLTGALLAACLLPLDGRGGVTGFTGDFMLFSGSLAAGRFLLILGALDTGSSLEGMGASRDAMVGALTEAGLLLAFAALVLATGQSSLSDMLATPRASLGAGTAAPLAMLSASVFALLLAEASRVPVDDPATHLELTMIHEAAVLDYSGPDLALILYGSALRLALLASLIAGMVVPRVVPGAWVLLAQPLALLLVAGAIGVVEGTMARLRMNRVPQLLVAVFALAAFATILLLARA